MDNIILSIINTAQTKPILAASAPSSTDFKATINERITEVSRINHITALKKYEPGELSPQQPQSVPQEHIDTDTTSTNPTSSETAHDTLIYSSLIKQLLLTKAIDPPEKWVDQNKARKAYNLD